MSRSWAELPPPKVAPLGGPGGLRALLRFLLLAVVIYGLMAVLLLLRLGEMPFRKRVLSPAIVQLACKGAMRIYGLPMRVRGRPMHQRGAIVANHASWLDIFVLNAAARVFFVSKVEVRTWPLIGNIARAAGTVFIARNPRDAKLQKAQFEERLIAGDRLLFFPEGTSTDSRRVVRFKSTLFAAFFTPRLRDKLWIQPASVIYRAPEGEDSRYYGWWADMTFAPHFLKVLAARRAGGVEVVFHDPVRVADFADRKALAAYCEEKVRAAVEAGLGANGSSKGA